MGRIRFYIALVCARLIYMAIRLLNRSSGSSFVGMVTLKICPQFLAYCKDFVKCAITVTGTNGKSTTSGILAQIIEQKNAKIVHNSKGANMLTGVANAFALSILPFKLFDFAVIESDEAYLTKLYDSFEADYLIVTNLFKDQVDRYADVSITAEYIRNAISKNSKLKLLLNADDPLVSSLGSNNEVKYFGIEDVEYADINNGENYNVSNETYNCVCGKPLSYSKNILAQEGHYYCESCDYKRPEPTFKGYVKVFQNSSFLKVVYNDKEYDFDIPMLGLYNAYNALAAISMALLLEIDKDVIDCALASYKTMFGRAERRVINGHNALIQLIKNPVGANEVLKTVDLKTNILIAINDKFGDGRDISWLWDAEFERLKDVENIIVTSGLRAKDMASRLRDAGVPQEKIVVEEDLKKAVQIATKTEDVDVTILPSYTALLELDKIKF